MMRQIRLPALMQTKPDFKKWISFSLFLVGLHVSYAFALLHFIFLVLGAVAVGCLMTQ